MKVLRAAEIACFGAGVALVAVYLGARGVGEVQRRSELRRFDEARAARVESPLRGPSDVDTRLWSPQRVERYRESLSGDVGAPLAVLRIPKIGLEVPVLDGTDDLRLNRGVGWIEGTALPGQNGNLGIAGHRDGFFRGLKDVVAGDVLELETLDGVRAYRVDDIRIVNPSDVSVLAPTDAPTVTLVTCYPFYFVGSAPQRYIVRARPAP